MQQKKDKIAIVMGSQSDFATMRYCEKVLKSFKISFDTMIVSAHRTPKRMFEFAKKAEKKKLFNNYCGCRRVCTSTWNDCSNLKLASNRCSY